MKATLPTIHITVENLSKWLLDQAHRAGLTEKQFNSVLVISRSRFRRDLPSLLHAPVEPLFPAPAGTESVPVKVKKVHRRSAAQEKAAHDSVLALGGD